MPHLPEGCRRRSSCSLLDQRKLLRVAQGLRQKAAGAWRVAEFPIRRGQGYCKPRPIANAHEKGCGMVTICFGPSREQKVISRCCTFQLVRGLGVTARR